MRRLILSLLVTSCLLISACRKQQQQQQPAVAAPAPSSEPTATLAQESASAEEAAVPPAQQREAPPPAPTPAMLARADNAVRQNIQGDVDATLTAELRTFVQQKKRLPVSFAEFAGLRLDTIPRPPEGKKWVIDTESLEVKAVKGQ